MAIVHPKVFAASVKGPLHDTLKTPCQDAKSYKTFPGGGLVIAVADGLGSAAKSQLGSQLAVETAVQAYGEVIRATPPIPEFKKRAEETLRRCVKTLEAKAQELGCPLRDLACTMILVVVDKGKVWAAHIGDGAVVARKKEGLAMVSEPGESEYANEVTPLTSDKWESAVRYGGPAEDVYELAVFTDGCQRAAFSKQGGMLTAHEGFFYPLFNFAQKQADTEEARREGDKEIEELLGSAKIREHSDDDKTLVIAVLQARKGALPVAKPSSGENVSGAGKAFSSLPAARPHAPAKASLPSAPRSSLGPAAVPLGGGTSRAVRTDGLRGISPVTLLAYFVLAFFVAVGIMYWKDRSSGGKLNVGDSVSPIFEARARVDAPQASTAPARPSSQREERVNNSDRASHSADNEGSTKLVVPPGGASGKPVDPAKRDFPEAWLKQANSDKFFKRGEEFETKGNLLSAYAAFQLADELGKKRRSKAGDRWSALYQKLDAKGDLGRASLIYSDVKEALDKTRKKEKEEAEAKSREENKWLLIPGVKQTRAFEMYRSEVTVAQYMACVDAEKCSEPDQRLSVQGEGCDWSKDRLSYPVNCVTWEQACAFCEYAEARLPAQEEWDYAARSAGKNYQFPWGDASPTCDRVVMPGCKRRGIAPVCSSGKGNTEQGLCDMAGNVAEWAQDSFTNHDWFKMKDIEYRVVRGGSWMSAAVELRTNAPRIGFEGGTAKYDRGFRCVRDKK